jgi:hypothetical protein
VILVDDFLTRRAHDAKPYPHGLGTNIPLDYDEMTVADELAAIHAVHEMGIEMMLFVCGYIFDAAKHDADIRNALLWVRDTGIAIAGHGYYHTEPEHLAGYVPYGEMTLNAMKGFGIKPPYLWRYPRHEEVGKAYIQRIGFELVPYHHYLDPELNKRRTLDVLRGHEHHNAWVHSCYLTKVYLEEVK